jgi:hypothetical protein
MRCESDQPVENPVGSGEDAVKIGAFRDPAHIFRVRADDVDGLSFEEILEIFLQADPFSGVNRD